MSNRYAIISAGTVENVINWDGDTAQWRPPEGAVAVRLADDAVVGPGYTYDGRDFTAPVPVEPEPTVEPVPEAISPAQLYIALYRLHGVTPEQLNAVVNGVIAQVGGDGAVEAAILWARATECRRDHPLIPVAGGVLGLDSDAIDQVFRVGATIV